MNVLVVDDDVKIVKLLKCFLETHGYRAKGVHSASEARASLAAFNNFDVAIVDCMMPAESGIEFVKTLRESSSLAKDMPVLMLTALDEIDNKIDGFDSGIDDYLTKPFDERELLARLSCLVKRTHKPLSAKIVHFENCSFNLETGEFAKDGHPLALSTTEIVILKMLCQKPNQAVSREELSKKMGLKISDRSIDVQITRLRRKIGDTSKDSMIIKTIRGLGYSIII